MEVSDYTFGERLLHRLALGVPLITRTSFQLDGLLPGRGKIHPDERHVFVSGLARAGTTILMRAFYDTRRFRSLTYRDMPFVLMPGIWQKASSPFLKHGESQERPHGDGILVEFDSPEAFEEVFWRIFSGDEYIFADCLRPHRVNKELIERFRLYVRRIVGGSGDCNRRRYLSKNNNNILRLEAIRAAFPRALIVIPFRDPLQHALSLLNQHQKFCVRHSLDKFSYDYMRWLGHHEFGMTHKPFRFEKEFGVSSVSYEVKKINYWLTIWISTYSYLLNKAPSDSVFVCFEELCKSPAGTLRYLFEAADILVDAGKISKAFNAPPIRDETGVDKTLENKARQIYAILRARAA